MRRKISFLSALCLVFLIFTVNALACDGTLANFQNFGLQMMSEDEAKARILEVDPEAASAENILVYPSAESYGAYVFVCTHRVENVYSSGNFWYITPSDAYLLGKGDYNWSWGLSTTTPEVFYNCYGKVSARYAKACVLIQNRPVIIPSAEKLHSLYHVYTALIGYTGQNDPDRAFLKVDTSDPAHVQLYQIEAIELNRNQFLSLKGAESILRLLEEAYGYTIDQCLYWEGSAIALNLIRDNAPYHVYLYFADGALTITDTWMEDPIGALSGFASPCQNLDLPTLKSWFR